MKAGLQRLRLPRVSVPVALVMVAAVTASQSWKWYGDTPYCQVRLLCDAVKRRDVRLLYSVCHDQAGYGLEKRTVPPKARFRLIAEDLFSGISPLDAFRIGAMDRRRSFENAIGLCTVPVDVRSSSGRAYQFRVGVIATSGGFLFRRWRVMPRPTLERLYTATHALDRSAGGRAFRRLWLAAGGQYSTQNEDPDWIL